MKKFQLIFILLLVIVPCANGQGYNMLGKWSLENVLLAKYTDNDSIVINYDSSKINFYQFEIFDEIQFEENEFYVVEDDEVLKFPYLLKDKNLSLMCMAVPYEYWIDLENSSTNVLSIVSRQYGNDDIEPQKTSEYKIQLTYARKE